jgi:acetyltransferase
MLVQSALSSIRARAPDMELLLVNPHHDTLYGHRCLRSSAELPEQLDLVVIATPWSAVSGVLAQLLQKQANAVVCISVATEAGWPWESRAGLLNKLQRQLKPASLRWIGPASPGLMLCERGINLSLCSSFPRAGHVAYVGQSDAIASALGEFGAQQGIGFSHLLTLGDEVDVSIAEMMDFLVTDAPTHAALIYIETIIDPPRFFSALRALASRKPVAVLRAGSQNAAEVALWKALVARCGALAVDDLEQLCDHAHLDIPRRSQPGGAPLGTRFAVAGNSSALLRLTEAALQRAGFAQASLSKATHSTLKKLQAESIKVGGGIHLGRDAGPKRYNESALALLADPQVDALLLVHHANAFSESQLIASALVPIAEQRAPVLAAMVGPQPLSALNSLAERGIKAFATPEAAVRAYASICNLNALQTRLTAIPNPLAQLPDSTQQAWLAINAALPETQSARDAQLMQALLAPQQLPDLQADLALLSLAVHFIQHATFGRYALLQRYQQSAVIPLPITQAHALDALAALDIQAGLLQAHSSVQALVRLSDWAIAAGVPTTGAADVRLLELTLTANELHVELVNRLSTANSPLPLDALSAPSANSVWMSSAGGQRLILRDIRAEDEPALTRGFLRLSADEIRMRFMFPLKQLTHELAAKLTQLDYRREIALALCAPEAPGHAELFGVVRASLDVYQKRAEFAIVIPRALSGQGFGRRMLVQLMLRCRSLGMLEIWGDVLIENEPMLALVRKLAFDIEAHPDVRHQVRVRKRLG